MKSPRSVLIQRASSSLAPYKTLPLPDGWETTEMTGTTLYLNQSQGIVTFNDPRKPAPVPLRRKVKKFIGRSAVKVKMTLTVGSSSSKRRGAKMPPSYSNTYPYSIMMRVLTPKKPDPVAVSMAGSSLQIKRFGFSRETERDLRVGRKILPAPTRVPPSPELVDWYWRSAEFVENTNSEKGLVCIPEMEVVRSFTPRRAIEA